MNQNYINEILAIIRSNKGNDYIKEELLNYHENDIAKIFPLLSKEERLKLYKILDQDTISDIFSYLDEPTEYLDEMSNDAAADILEKMDTDDAIDILEEMEESDRKELIDLMDKEAADDIKLISSYSDDFVIEGVEDKNKKFYVGVQWHPESMKNDINSRLLIEEFINKINFNQLMNFNIKNLYCNYGLNDGSTIINLLISFLNKKNFNQNLTFKELYERTNNILIINSSNITKKINEVFDYLLTPDMEILKAVRMSISVPFIFSPVKFNNCLYVDGGIINSFMYIWAIKNRYKKDNIIGVLLNDKINKNQNYNFYSYLMDIYYSLYSNQTEELNLNEIINIEIDNCSISKTNISDIEKNKMIELGFNKTIEYFKN